MTNANIVLILVGLFITIIGLASLINPNIERWINLPGNSTIKAIVAIIVGIIIIIIGLIFQFPQ